MKTETQRAILAIRLVAATFIIQVFISLPAWFSFYRQFPHAPVLQGFLVPVVAESILSALLLSGLIVLLFRPLLLWLLLAVPALLAVLCMADINRLQPWVYAYALMMAGMAWAVTKKDLRTGTLLMRVILSGTYFWSGLQKLNPHYALEMFPWLANFGGNTSYLERHFFWAYASAALEMSAGIGLWVPGLKRASVFVILGMHLFILLSLGPLLHNWNAVVWPWNICFAMLTFMLFYQPLPRVRASGMAVPSGFAISLCWVLPALNLVSLWPDFLSGGFYTSLAPQAAFYYDKADSANIPPAAAPFTRSMNDGVYKMIMMDYWAIADMKLPLFTGSLAHLRAGEMLARQLRHPENAGLRIVYKTRYSARQQMDDIHYMPVTRRAAQILP